MAKTVYLYYCGVTCFLLFYVPPVMQLRRKEHAKWKHIFSDLLHNNITVRCERSLNSPRAFTFVSNQHDCFLPASCCFLPALWDPLGLNISAQTKRLNLTAIQSPPKFRQILQRAIPFGERGEVLCLSFVILLCLLSKRLKL